MRCTSDQTLAQALYDAFLAAKRHSLERLYDIDALAVMVPWLVPEMAESFVALGRDPWPYGCAANRDDFDVFLRYLGSKNCLRSPCREKRCSRGNCSIPRPKA